jgi:hypothetical protein
MYRCCGFVRKYIYVQDLMMIPSERWHDGLFTKAKPVVCVCVCGEDTTVQWCEISAIPRVISCMCMLWKLKFDFDLYVFEHDDLDEQEDV